MAEEREQTTTQRTKKKGARKKKASSTAAPVSPGNSAPRRAAKRASPETQAAPSARVRRQVSSEERYRMIQEAAYYRAEKEGFNCDPWRCWLVAEAEIDAQLNPQA